MGLSSVLHLNTKMNSVFGGPFRGREEVLELCHDPYI